jgi:hypothetical protein
MPLKKIPYKTLGELIKKNLSLNEEAEDEQLFKSLRMAKVRVALPVNETDNKLNALDKIRKQYQSKKEENSKPKD